MSDPSLVMRLPGQASMLSTPAGADPGRLGFGDASAFGTYVPRDADPTQPLDFAAAVGDLGMDASTAMVWSRFLRDSAAQMPDEVGFRSALVDRMRADGMPSPMRKALMARSLKLYRAQRKSPRTYGGWHAVRKSQAARIYNRCRKAIDDATQGGGLSMMNMSPFVDEFGTSILAQALYDAIDEGQLDFDGDRFSQPVADVPTLRAQI